MNTEKIAIIADSGTDVPKRYLAGNNIFIVPLYLNYKNKTYADGVDITTDEVCERLQQELPKTSLPSIEDIQTVYKKVLAEGFNKIIVITISSGLSGTHNAMKIAAEDFKDVEFFFADTRNIGIGAGMTVLAAARLIKRGLAFSEITEKLELAIENTVVFFIVDTLEYLHKGGRIGGVTYVLGSAFDLKPIISCNKEGTYYSAAKGIGKKQALNKALALTEKFSKSFTKVNVAVANIRAKSQAEEFYNKAKENIGNAREFILSGICPALTVHTGPGTIGICAQMEV